MPHNYILPNLPDCPPSLHNLRCKVFHNPSFPLLQLLWPMHFHCIHITCDFVQKPGCFLMFLFRSHGGSFPNPLFFPSSFLPEAYMYTLFQNPVRLPDFPVLLQHSPSPLFCTPLYQASESPCCEHQYQKLPFPPQTFSHPYCRYNLKRSLKVRR